MILVLDEQTSECWKVPKTRIDCERPTAASTTKWETPILIKKYQNNSGYRNISSHDRIRDGDETNARQCHSETPQHFLSPWLCRHHLTWTAKCRSQSCREFQVPKFQNIITINNIIETSISLHSSWLGSLHASSKRVFMGFSMNCPITPTSNKCWGYHSPGRDLMLLSHRRFTVENARPHL